MISPNLKTWLSRLNSNRSSDDTSTRLQTYVHPCVINNQPHIIYPRGLKADSPHIFKQLSHYFKNMGYQLKEDQRQQQNNTEQHFKRRSWVPIVLFSAGLLFESTAHADIEINLDNNSSTDQQQIKLQLISNNAVLSNIRHRLNNDAIKIQDMPLTSMAETANVLFKILNSRYQKNKNDPEHIQSDLRTMSEYFSRYPEVVSLLNALKNKNWTLVFDRNNWTTIASGNIFEIEKAEIHINTRSAAQLRLNDSCKDNPVCIASPADALLHELLHVHSMFNDTETFMAQGGMNNVLYPYQHERNIIKQERELYKKMSKQDGIKRPSRHSHAGRIVKANCSTCIK